MSRGYSKSSGFGARETVIPRLRGDAKRAKEKKTLSDAVEELQTNLVDRETLENLLDSVHEHQTTVPAKKVEKSSDEERRVNKDRKLKIAELIKKLSPEVRRAIEVPRSTIEKLYRGVKDGFIEEGNGRENGKFVYGFTTDKDIATAFADGSIDKKPTIVSAKDIESFGGIVSVDKLYSVAREFNRRLWGDDKTFDPKYSSPVTDGWRAASDKKQREYAQNSFTERENKYENEDEMLVYDIKFKKTGNEFFK